MNEVTVPAIHEEILTDVTDVTEAVVPEIDEPLPLAADSAPDQEMTKPAESISGPDEAPCEEPDKEPEADLPVLPTAEELHAELARLRAELEETKSLHARMAAELGEFHTLFPEVNLSALPESIWEQVKSGIPLAASYALYEKKCILHREHAAKVNLRNAKKTPGAAGKDTPAEYFSPDEVRAMSQSEVRNNYQKILESMKKWNS